MIYATSLSLRGKLDAMSAISDRAEKENRKFSEDEQQEYDTLKSAYERQKTKTAGDSIRQERHEMLGESARRPEWRDRNTGEPVAVIGREQRFVDLVGNQQSDDAPHPSSLSLGRAIVAQLRGSWTGAENEQRALSEGSNIAGGYLVPSMLSATTIDLARANSVTLKAGAQIVSLDGEILSLARVATDPSYETKSENASFAEGSIAFDQVSLTSHTVGTYIVASREIIQDSPNASDLIQETISKALAAKLDLYALAGTGSAQPLGINNTPSVQTISVGGAIDWGHILDAVEDVRDSNAEANAMVLTPALRTSLSKLLINGETNHYVLDPPADVRQLSTFMTTAQDSGTVTIGDFTQLLFGVRQQPFVEVSTEAGETFQKHQVGIKITWRGDFALAHGNQFVVLSGAS